MFFINIYKIIIKIKNSLISYLDLDLKIIFLHLQTLIIFTYLAYFFFLNLNFDIYVFYSIFLINVSIFKDWVVNFIHLYYYFSNDKIIYFFENTSNIFFSPITNFRTLFSENVDNFFENFFSKLKISKIQIKYNNFDTDILIDLRILVLVITLIFFFFFIFFNIFKFFYISIFYILFTIFFIFYLYNFIKFYDFISVYIDFLSNDSFKNRNLYIDSNYFLTSNSLFGIEKFSDISVPWLVDYEDSGWGDHFNIQNQISQISERERKFVIDELAVEYSPQMENLNIKSGSLSGRLLKLKQRLLMLIDIFKSYEYFIEKYNDTWSKTIFRSDLESRIYNSKNIINFFFLKENNYSFFNINTQNDKSKKFNLVSNIENKIEFIDTLIINYKIDDKFILPKKNNITNDNFSKIGKLQDRKQSVFRKLTENLDTVSTNNKIKSRFPDFSKESNYIFERQLQAERSLEYDIKSYLKQIYEKRLSKYYYTEIPPNSNIIKKRYESKNENINLFNNNFKFFFLIKNNNIKNKKINYDISELNLENLLKFLSLKKQNHNFVKSRRLEFVYFKNSNRNINGFFKNTHILEHSFIELLKKNKLGIGMFTYQDFENKTLINNYYYIQDFENNILNNKNANNVLPWLKKNHTNTFYKQLIKFVDINFSKLNKEDKKFLISGISFFASKSWFDFENSNIYPNVSDIFKLGLYEFLATDKYFKYFFFNNFSTFKHNNSKNSENISYFNNGYVTTKNIINCLLLQHYKIIDNAYKKKINYEEKIFYKKKYIYLKKNTIYLKFLNYKLYFNNYFNINNIYILDDYFNNSADFRYYKIKQNYLFISFKSINQSTFILPNLPKANYEKVKLIQNNILKNFSSSLKYFEKNLPLIKANLIIDLILSYSIKILKYVNHIFNKSLNLIYIFLFFFENFIFINFYYYIRKFYNNFFLLFISFTNINVCLEFLNFFNNLLIFFKKFSFILIKKINDQFNYYLTNQLLINYNLNLAIKIKFFKYEIKILNIFKIFINFILNLKNLNIMIKLNIYYNKKYLLLTGIKKDKIEVFFCKFYKFLILLKYYKNIINMSINKDFISIIYKLIFQYFYSNYKLFYNNTLLIIKKVYFFFNLLIYFYLYFSQLFIFKILEIPNIFFFNLYFFYLKYVYVEFKNNIIIEIIRKFILKILEMWLYLNLKLKIYKLKSITCWFKYNNKLILYFIDFVKIINLNFYNFFYIFYNKIFFLYIINNLIYLLYYYVSINIFLFFNDFIELNFYILYSNYFESYPIYYKYGNFNNLFFKIIFIKLIIKDDYLKTPLNFSYKYKLLFYNKKNNVSYNTVILNSSIKNKLINKKNYFNKINIFNFNLLIGEIYNFNKKFLKLYKNIFYVNKKYENLEQNYNFKLFFTYKQYLRYSNTLNTSKLVLKKYDKKIIFFNNSLNNFIFSNIFNMIKKKSFNLFSNLELRHLLIKPNNFKINKNFNYFFNFKKKSIFFNFFFFNYLNILSVSDYSFWNLQKKINNFSNIILESHLNNYFNTLYTSKQLKIFEFGNWFYSIKNLSINFNNLNILNLFYFDFDYTIQSSFSKNIIKLKNLNIYNYYENFYEKINDLGISKLNKFSNYGTFNYLNSISFNNNLIKNDFLNIYYSNEKLELKKNNVNINFKNNYIFDDSILNKKINKKNKEKHFKFTNFLNFYFNNYIKNFSKSEKFTLLNLLENNIYNNHTKEKIIITVDSSTNRNYLNDNSTSNFFFILNYIYSKNVLNLKLINSNGWFYRFSEINKDLNSIKFSKNNKFKLHKNIKNNIPYFKFNFYNYGVIFFNIKIFRIILNFIINLSYSNIPFLEWFNTCSIGNVKIHLLLERQDLIFKIFLNFSNFIKNNQNFYIFDLVNIIKLFYFWKNNIILNINNLYFYFYYKVLRTIIKVVLIINELIIQIFCYNLLSFSLENNYFFYNINNLYNFLKKTEIFINTKCVINTVITKYKFELKLIKIDNIFITEFLKNKIMVNYTFQAHFNNFINFMYNFISKNSNILFFNLNIILNTEKYLEKNDIDIFSIMEYISYEKKNYYNLSNNLYFYKLNQVCDQFKNKVYKLFLFENNNFNEFWGQIIWLKICIYFDFIFERAVEFDFLTEANPISDTIFIIVEFIRSIFSGKIIENIPTFFFNYFEKDHQYSDIDDDDYFEISNNDDSFGDDSSYGLSNIDDMDSFEFIGWGSNVSIGTDPGNEFSTINDLLEFPGEIEKFLLTDISDFYNNIFGLDSPKIGSLAPSFDITLPINSLWLIGVLYYNPTFGGMIFIDFKALFEFFKIIYIDRRTSFFSKIYEIVDYSVFDYKDMDFLFYKLKINYYFKDILQIKDSVYLNPLDFVELLFFYIIYLTSYFGLWVPVFIFLLISYFSKINKYFERFGRQFNFNSFLLFFVISNTYNYFLFRYFYYFLSNLFLFIKMSVTVLVFLTLLYLFTEGFHIFSILRVYSSDQESLSILNSTYFNLERDPFVEKSVILDDLWDTFKYESNIDDEWSRIHYFKDTTEILGGDLEESSVYDNIGFAKKHNFNHFLYEQDSEFNSTVSILTRNIPQQIHNRLSDEESYSPKFIKDSVLEREFFRESEMYGPEIEGSLDWSNRSKNIIDTLEDNWKFNKWFIDQHIIESDNFSHWNWGFSKDNEDYYNDLYDALLINISDPKWLYNSSNILSEMSIKPIIFNHSKVQLLDNNFNTFNNKREIELSSKYRISSLLDRNSGIVDNSPILDYWDNNPLTDLGISNYHTFGSSIGTLSNSNSNYDTVTSDIATQYYKHNFTTLINQPIYFNYVNKNDDFGLSYSGEKMILENFFETIYNTKPNINNNKNYARITEKFRNRFFKKRIPNFNNKDNFHKKMGRNWILENNFKIKKFVTDGIPEGYFNPTTYVFVDYNNDNNNFLKIKNLWDLNLENTRRRDLKYVDIDGSEPSVIYYNEMLSNSLDKFLYSNYDSIYNHHDSYTKYYENNEYLIKFELDEPNEYWTPRKYPRQRWQWLRKWGHDSPHQEFKRHREDEVNSIIKESELKLKNMVWGHPLKKQYVNKMSWLYSNNFNLNKEVLKKKLQPKRKYGKFEKMFIHFNDFKLNNLNEYKIKNFYNNDLKINNQSLIKFLNIVNFDIKIKTLSYIKKKLNFNLNDKNILKNNNFNLNFFYLINIFKNNKISNDTLNMGLKKNIDYKFLKIIENFNDIGIKNYINYNIYTKFKNYYFENNKDNLNIEKNNLNNKFKFSYLKSKYFLQLKTSIDNIITSDKKKINKLTIFRKYDNFIFNLYFLKLNSIKNKNINNLNSNIGYVKERKLNKLYLKYTNFWKFFYKKNNFKLKNIKYNKYYHFNNKLLNTYNKFLFKSKYKLNHLNKKNESIDLLFLKKKLKIKKNKLYLLKINKIFNLKKENNKFFFKKFSKFKNIDNYIKNISKLKNSNYFKKFYSRKLYLNNDSILKFNKKNPLFYLTVKNFFLLNSNTFKNYNIWLKSKKINKIFNKTRLSNTPNYKIFFINNYDLNLKKKIKIENVVNYLKLKKNQNELNKIFYFSNYLLKKNKNSNKNNMHTLVNNEKIKYLYSKSKFFDILEPEIFTNNSYFKKIQEYILFKKNKNLKIENDVDSQLGKNLIRDSLFLNNSWSISNNNIIYYKLFNNLKLPSDISKSFTDLKKNENLTSNSKKKIMKSLIKSRKSRKFIDVKGSNSLGELWPLSYRMHALILPKYSENPIFASDEEAYREYTELRNQNFARRYNDLEVIGQGNVREIKNFTEFSLNPREMGRTSGDFLWYDKIEENGIKNIGFRLFSDKEKRYTYQNFFDWGSTYNSGEVETEVKELMLSGPFIGSSYSNFYDSISYGDSYIKNIYGNLNNRVLKKIYKYNLRNKNIMKPWAFDFKTDRNWLGSISWNFQKNLNNLESMLSEDYYITAAVLEDKSKVDQLLSGLLEYDKDAPLVKSLSRVDSFKNNTKFINLFKNNYLDIKNINIKKLDVWANRNIELETSLRSGGNYIRIDGNGEGYKWKKEKKENPTTSLIETYNTAQKVYNIPTRPIHQLSSVDIDNNSELKHDWRTKYFQYGKMYKSLEQNTILQDYYSKFITLYSRAVTPKQMDDYFWTFYKPFKKNKYSKFYKKYNLTNSNFTLFSNLKKNNWNSKINNPDFEYSDSLYKNNGLEIENYNRFPNLGKNWVSNYIKNKTKQSNSKFGLDQFETYDSYDSVFENINFKNKIKKKNINQNFFFLSPSKNIFFKPQTKSYINSQNSEWQKITNLIDRGNSVKSSNKKWWSIKTKPLKSRAVRELRNLEVMDLIFGSLRKEKKQKNPLIDENNAAHRFLAIENLKLKNIKNIKIEYSNKKFKNHFSSSINFLDSLRSVYEIPTDKKFNINSEVLISDTIFDSISVNSNNKNNLISEDLKKNYELFQNVDLKTSQKILSSVILDINDLNIYQKFNSSSKLNVNNDNNLVFSDYWSENNSISDILFEKQNEDLRISSNLDKNIKIGFEDFFENFDDFKHLDNYFSNNNIGSDNFNNWTENIIIKDSENKNSTKLLDYWNIENSEESSNISEFSSIDNSILDKNYANENYYDDYSENSELFSEINEDSTLIGDEDYDNFEYYNNKKQNSKKLLGSVDYLSSDPDIYDESSIELVDSDFKNTKNLQLNYEFNSVDSQHRLAQNQNLFYNYFLYNKNKNSYKIKNFFIKNKAFKKNNLKKNLGFSENFSKLGKDLFLISPNFYNFENYSNFNFNETTINDDLENLIKFENQKKNIIYYPENIIKNYISSSKLLNYAIKILSLNSSKHKSFYINKNLKKRKVNVDNDKFEFKNKNLDFSGKIIQSPDNSFINILNISNSTTPGLLNNILSIYDTKYINTYKKIEPNFGNERFRYSNNDYINENNIENTILNKKIENILETPENKKIFNFGFGLVSDNLSNQNITKEATNHYFKYKDSVGYVFKNIDNFFRISDIEDKQNESYIANISIPVSIKFKKKENNKQINIKNSKNNIFDLFDLANDNFNIANKGNSYNINDNSAIQNIFKNSKVKIGSNNKKLNSNSFRIYSASESIYPSPVIKSLGIESKLFNKINSLRIFGAGRLNDYLYKPKLKHLLKNQSNYYNFDNTFWDDDLEEQDDIFLYNFDDNDNQYDSESISNIFDQTLNIKNNNKKLTNLDNIVQFEALNKKSTETNFKNFEIPSEYSINNKIYKLKKKEIELDFLDDDIDDFDFDEYDLGESEEFELDSDYGQNFKNIGEIKKNDIILNIVTNKYNDIGNIYNKIKSLSNDFDNESLFNYDDVETVENYTDIDKLYNEDLLHSIDSDNSILLSKRDWLFKTYKDLVNSHNKYSKKQWLDSEKNSNNFDYFENINLNSEIFNNLNNINLTDSQNSIISSSKNIGFENIENSSNIFYDRKELFGYNLNKNSDDLDFIQKDTISDVVKSKNFEKTFDNYGNDLKDLQNYMDLRFSNLQIPLEKTNEFLNKNIVGDHIYSKNSDLDSLDFRQKNIESNFIFIKQNKKNNDPNLYNYKVSKKYLKKSNQSDTFIRSNDIQNLDYSVDRFMFYDVLNDLNNYENMNFNIVENVESDTISKIKKLNYYQLSALKDSIGLYFIKKQNKESFDKFSNFYINKNIYPITSLDNDNSYTDKYFFKNNIFDKIWNIKHDISESNWNVTSDSLKKINQSSTTEKKIILNIISKLYNQKTKYNLSKNSFLLDFNNMGDFVKKDNNFKILIRKTNAISNAQFGRRKYKKLKKIYWGRLDIIEKYINNIKKSIQFNKNNKILTILKSTKPIHNKISNNLLKNYENIKNTEIYNIDKKSNLFLTEIKNFFIITNFKNFKNLIKKNNKIINNFPLDYKNESFGSLTKNKLKNFDKFSEFYTVFKSLYENNNIEVINFLNIDENVDNANYLSYKFENLLKSQDQEKTISKLFNTTGESLDYDEGFEYPLIAYSKIRNDMSKLQLGKFFDNYLPISVVSTFLNKIPNLSTYNYINETEKPTNFYLNKLPNKNLTFLTKTNKNITNNNQFSKLNTPKFYNKSSIVDQFGIYHKNMQRPGLQLKNNYQKLPISPFRKFKNFETITRRSLDFGLSQNIYKNSPVTRRSFDLAIRKFGPDIRTNSTLAGYGQLSEITDFNLNSEEDSGLHNNLGYPIINEQNLYIYDFPEIVPKYGYSLFEDKISSFVWDNDHTINFDENGKDKHKNDRNTIFDESENPVFDIPFKIIKKSGILLPSFLNIFNPSSSYLNGRRFFEEKDPEGHWESISPNIDYLYYLFFAKKPKKLKYNLSPNFSKYVQIWKGVPNRKYAEIPEEDPEEANTFFEDPKYNSLFSMNLTAQELENENNFSYAHTLHKDLPYDVISNFELSSDKIWDSFSSENIYGPFFEKKVTVPFSKDKSEKNIGPLGYEEGDSLYDNRLLNRGWFPEKLAWNLGLRSQSKVGSDSAALELMSDYAYSFSHDLESFGKLASDESLKSLSWAGKNNNIFGTIDDIVEGLGIEENIPFKPKIARTLWEWDNHVERPSYEDYDMRKFSYNEDDEDELYGNWDEPELYNEFKDDNFSTLALSNYEAETNSWMDSKYFGNVDTAYIPGTSIPLADNNLYDGLVSDFTHFVYEKFPTNPISSNHLINLPLITSGLFSNGDFIDSEITEFSNYVTGESINSRWYYKDGLENNKKEMDSHYNQLETFKPKDSFNFSPNIKGFLKFDPEWVINGEGWLGNNGSNVATISNKNIPFSYLNPESSIYSQAKGLHSFKITNDLDIFLGDDSPYFALSDYQNNRIIRGMDNDISNIPIGSGWNMISKSIPDSLNTFWSHRLGSKSFIHFDEEGQEFSLDAYNWNELNETIGIFSGEGYSFSNTLEDNSDYIVFNSSSFNQRDLWWRSISSGNLSVEAKKELSENLINDNSEKFRDFITSYDYRIFGKSWMNPQEVKMPLKSFNFYGDSQINDFLSSGISETHQSYDNHQNPKDKLLLDYTYGFFKNSQNNFDLNLNFYSIRLRPMLFKIYNFTNYYLSYWTNSFISKIIILMYNFLNYIIFKIEIFNLILNIYLYNFSNLNNFYLIILKFILNLLEILISIINSLISILNNFQIFSTISDTSILNSFSKNIIFTIYYNFFNYNYIILNKLYLHNLLILFISYIIFIFTLILF